ncbi:MAG: hypothetical protein Q8P97_01605 [bacterium]|nr:hypothetical protein [bacterium]
MKIEYRQLWKAFVLIGEAMQAKAIGQELGNLENMNVVDENFFKGLKAVKDMSIDLRISFHRVWLRPDNIKHTFGTKSHIFLCSEETSRVASLDISIIFDYSETQGNRSVRAGDIHADLLDQIETDDDESAKPARTADAADQNGLLMSDADRVFLKRHGLCFLDERQ